MLSVLPPLYKVLTVLPFTTSTGYTKSVSLNFKLMNHTSQNISIKWRLKMIQNKFSLCRNINSWLKLLVWMNVALTLDSGQVVLNNTANINSGKNKSTLNLAVVIKLVYMVLNFMVTTGLCLGFSFFRWSLWNYILCWFKSSLSHEKNPN